MFRKDFVWGVASSAYQVEGRDKTMAQEPASGTPLPKREEPSNIIMPMSVPMTCTVIKRTMR